VQAQGSLCIDNRLRLNQNFQGSQFTFINPTSGTIRATLRINSYAAQGSSAHICRIAEQSDADRITLPQSRFSLGFELSKTMPDTILFLLWLTGSKEYTRIFSS
jgi:hypothetical protein